MQLLRPHSSLISQGLIACIVFLTPVFVVLYFMTIPGGPWMVVVITQGVATLLVTFGAASYFWSAIWVGPGVISERGFFARFRRFETPEIGSILLAETYSGPDLATVPQLFVCDHNGKTLVRMRGQFWSRETMDAVIEALEVPVTRAEEPVSLSELRRDFPQMLYWFERHPVWAGLAFSGFIAVFGVGLLLVLRLIGAM